MSLHMSHGVIHIACISLQLGRIVFFAKRVQSDLELLQVQEKVPGVSYILCISQG